MNKTSITAIVVAVVVVAGGLIYWHSTMESSSNTTPAYQTPTPTSATTIPTTTPTSSPAAGASTTVSVGAGVAPSHAPQSFAVSGNDETGTPTTITVPQGTPVTITFTADAEGTYHGGLDFRSSVVSTGPIAPGSSKTVAFTATDSFTFTPYWPSTNIKKPYVINLVVQ